jgi:pimeloyl-ACP methyl ester carboxylesterase
MTAMRTLHDFAHPSKRAPALIILLPGALQRPEDLVDAGMVDAVRRRSLAVDLALADLDLRIITEVTDGSALRRLEQGVLQPALREGYRQIWLAGLSIGGLIALAYAARYPARLTGLCLLSPYPGSRMLTGAIRAVGIDGWRADRIDDAAQRDDEHLVWRWLAQRPRTPRIHLGYGEHDRFAAGQQLMARALAAHCVDIVAGGHDWPAWRRLWENFLDRNASRFAHHQTENTQ